MIAKTRGIVLRNTNYSENSIVAKIFTSVFGVQSYLINGIRNNKGAIKTAIIQPLNLLDLEVYHKPNGGLQRIKEARPNPMLQDIPVNISKSCVGMFVNEVLNKTLNEEEPHEDLFEFIEEFICFLDATEDSLALIPHYFLLGLSRHLGFFPELDHAVSLTLDLQEGRMVAEEATPYSLEANENELLMKLNTLKMNEIQAIDATKTIRISLLKKLISYYQIHIVGNVNFKSLDILNKVLHVDNNGTSIATNS
jgi:DNA repair protein RecO (recombination protein O)